MKKKKKPTNWDGKTINWFHLLHNKTPIGLKGFNDCQTLQNIWRKKTNFVKSELVVVTYIPFPSSKHLNIFKVDFLLFFSFLFIFLMIYWSFGLICYSISFRLPTKRKETDLAMRLLSI